MAEKFSPFTINVTTVDPGVVFDSQNMTCLIGGSDRDWYAPEKPAGGVAALDGFVDGGPNTCFAFSGDVVAKGTSGLTLVGFLGETIAHEAAHLVGLNHQSQLVSLTPFVFDEYYNGDAIRSPIMGGSSNNSTAQRNLVAHRQLAWTELPHRAAGRPDRPDPGRARAPVLPEQRLRHSRDGVQPRRCAYADQKRHRRSGRGRRLPLPGHGGPRFVPDQERAVRRDARARASIRISGTTTLIPVNLTLTNTGATIEATNLTVGTNYVLLVTGQGQYGDIGQYTVDGTKQQFATFDAASRTISVGGFIGNNNVTLGSNSSTNSLIVQDSLNGGPTASQSFPLNGVDTVIVFLGNGNDTLNIGGLNHADNSPINVTSNLGGGTDILRVGATGNNFTTFNVSRFAVEWTDAGVRTSRVLDSTAERLELIGSSDLDVFNVNSQDAVSRLFAYGNEGNDRMVVGPNVISTFSPEASFIGGLGTDTLEIAAFAINDPQEWYFSNDYVSQDPQHDHRTRLPRVRRRRREHRAQHRHRAPISSRSTRYSPASPCP